MVKVQKVYKLKTLGKALGPLSDVVSIAHVMILHALHMRTLMKVWQVVTNVVCWNQIKMSAKEYKRIKMETGNAIYVWPKIIILFSNRSKRLKTVRKSFKNGNTKTSFTFQTFRKANAGSEAIKVQSILRLWMGILLKNHLDSGR